MKNLNFELLNKKLKNIVIVCVLLLASNTVFSQCFTYTITDSTVSFQPNDVNAQLYYWDFGDGSVDSTTMSPQHTYSDTGVYTVCLTVKIYAQGIPMVSCSSCVDILIEGIDSTTTGGDSTTVSINQIDNKVNLNVFPNPFNDKIGVTFNNIEYKTLNIDIIDITGKIVIRKNSNQQMYTAHINTESLQKGIYFVKIRIDNEQVLIRKIIKQ